MFVTAAIVPCGRLKQERAFPLCLSSLQLVCCARQYAASLAKVVFNNLEIFSKSTQEHTIFRLFKYTTIPSKFDLVNKIKIWEY